MTWGEFKDLMQQLGVTDSAPISYIIVNEPSVQSVDVDYRADGSVCVTDA